MSELVLTIGNRNYSSWSLRAWLALEQTGQPYREEIIWFDEDETRERRLALSPTGRVPILRHGELVIWDSLAIGEYLAETFPAAGLWPASRPARARARSLCAEMHAGFQALRSALPMNCRARKAFRDRGAAAAADIARVVDAWTSARREFGGGGPFLFGTRSLADAFFAPVVSRFLTYAVPLEGEAAAYAETILAMPAMKDWMGKASSEGHAEPAYDALD